MEYLDIVNENGIPTGAVVERGQAHAEGILHRTSHVWLARNNGVQIELLLQKRSDIKASFPGCYDISSAGHIPAGTDYVPSAIRELEEELGVTASPEQLIFCGDRHVVWDCTFSGKPFHDRQISRVFLLWYNACESDFRLQQEEVSAVRWMELNTLISAVNENTIPHCIHPEELQMVHSAIHNTAEKVSAPTKAQAM